MNILTVAAHPDDEVLGAGGSIARLVKEGHKAYTLILGEGIASRYDKENDGGGSKEIEQLRKDAEDANKILGTEKTFFFDFPDNKFDSVPLLDIVKIVEKVKNSIEPAIIFTHYERDLNVDHRITYKAVIAAARPVPTETVKEIYSFEIPSSTEWSYPLTFSPNVFLDTSKSLDIKLEALKKCRAELKEYPHPRSIEGVTLIAKHRGMTVGLKSAEAFKAVRITR
jgi:LmbE family N-acetylglucosaminyl deacetylase